MTVETVPIARPEDLRVYLSADVDAFDEDRAKFLLRIAQTLAESHVSPLPDAALPVVLSAAARAYVNPTFVVQEVIGPYSVSPAKAGVYLTSLERADLRRASNRGSAFSVSLLPDGYELPCQ